MYKQTLTNKNFAYFISSKSRVFIIVVYFAVDRFAFIKTNIYRSRYRFHILYHSRSHYARAFALVLALAIGTATTFVLAAAVAIAIAIAIAIVIALALAVAVALALALAVSLALSMEPSDLNMTPMVTKTNYRLNIIRSIVDRSKLATRTSNLHTCLQACYWLEIIVRDR